MKPFRLIVAMMMLMALPLLSGCDSLFEGEVNNKLSAAVTAEYLPIFLKKGVTEIEVNDDTSTQDFYKLNATVTDKTDSFDVKAYCDPLAPFDAKLKKTHAGYVIEVRSGRGADDDQTFDERHEIIKKGLDDALADYAQKRAAADTWKTK